jgi:hypothetical protein
MKVSGGRPGILLKKVTPPLCEDDFIASKISPRVEVVEREWISADV